MEFMAETTARHFLAHKSFTDRSFETLRKAPGRLRATTNCARSWCAPARSASTARTAREWWRLLSRMDEYIERKQLDQIAREI